MEFNATFLVSAISFVVFTILMNMIFYKPLQRIVEKRQRFLDYNYYIAKSNADKSEALLKDRDDKLNGAFASAKNLINEKSDEANAQKDEQTAKARKESQKHLDKSRLYFKNATNSANEELKGQVVTLAQAISDKFLVNHDKIENVDNDLINKYMQG